MEPTATQVAGVPALSWGGAGRPVVLAVHGAQGNKGDAVVRRVADVAVPLGYQVVGVDLPGHGDRDDVDRLVPWVCTPELRQVYASLSAGGRTPVSVVACSLGAYFTLLALAAHPVARTMLLSPLVNMTGYIERHMAAHGITDERLRRERTVTLPDGPVLSWDYLTHARENPVRWNAPTSVLWGTRDAVVPGADIEAFAAASGAAVRRIDAGHAFGPEHDPLVTEWLTAGLG